jgi:small subunit ribosomal protein S17
MSNTQKKQPKHRRRLKGTVVSDKMAKTVTVEVMTLKKHPIYQKRYRTFKKYLAHHQNNVKIGDKVIIEECKPFSKKKKWQVVNKNS